MAQVQDPSYRHWTFRCSLLIVSMPIPGQTSNISLFYYGTSCTSGGELESFPGNACEPGTGENTTVPAAMPASCMTQVDVPRAGVNSSATVTCTADGAGATSAAPAAPTPTSEQIGAFVAHAASLAAAVDSAAAAPGNF